MPSAPVGFIDSRCRPERWQDRHRLQWWYSDGWSQKSLDAAAVVVDEAGLEARGEGAHAHGDVGVVAGGGDGAVAVVEPDDFGVGVAGPADEALADGGRGNIVGESVLSGVKVELGDGVDQVYPLFEGDGVFGSLVGAIGAADI